jgi:hypothetical protein
VAQKVAQVSTLMALADVRRNRTRCATNLSFENQTNGHWQTANQSSDSYEQFHSALPNRQVLVALDGRFHEGTMSIGLSTAVAIASRDEPFCRPTTLPPTTYHLRPI